MESQPGDQIDPTQIIDSSRDDRVEDSVPKQEDSPSKHPESEAPNPPQDNQSEALSESKIELFDQRDQSPFYGKAKFPKFEVETRDIIGNGSQQFLLVAFEKQDTDIHAHVYNLETKELELITATSICEKFHQAQLATFAKARDLFRKKLNLIRKSENHNESPEIKREQTNYKQDLIEPKDDNDTPTTTFNSSAKLKKKTSEVVKKPAKDKVIRRSKRLANQDIDHRETKKRKNSHDPKKDLSNPKKPLTSANKYIQMESRHKAYEDSKLNRDIRSENQSKKKLAEVNEDNLEPDSTTFHIERAEVVVPSEPKQLKEAQPKGESKHKKTGSSLLTKAVLPTGNVEEARVKSTDGSSGPTAPLYIPISWHEQQMSKIREAYFKNTILTMQMNEMLQLTSTAALFEKLNK